MAVERSTTWTGTNGDPWNLNTGSWTTVESTAALTTTTEDIQSNVGRARYASSGPVILKNHADTSYTVEDAEVRVSVERSSLLWVPGVFLRATGHAGSGDSYYLLTLSTTSGKSPTYGCAIYRCLSGTFTKLVEDTSVAGLNSISNTIEMAFRTTADGTDCLLQGKAWVGSEPAWRAVGDAAVDGSLAIVDSTATLKDTAGETGLYGFWNVGIATQNVFTWDDFTVDAIGGGSVTATADAALGTITAAAAATVNHPATASAPLGTITAAATATVAHDAVASAPLGTITGAAAATVTHPAVASAELGTITGLAAGQVRHLAVASAPLGAVAAVATATVGHDAVATAPLGGITATATSIVTKDNIRVGALTPTAIYIGSTPVTAVYVGSTLVYP